ncbi:thioesterase domain-containing protein [Lysinibacillus xylanilyticus]|uniref:thioesterase domain-containing protein n=1 Tax=Lysinibacillus xylanilyticus TaxID=582475 RepID=UPI003D067629
MGYNVILVPCAGCSIFSFMELSKKLTNDGIEVNHIKLSVDQDVDIKVDDIIQEIQEIIVKSPEKTIIFGHSMGGILILKLLECLPTNQLEKIKGLIISSSVPPCQLKKLQSRIPNVESNDFIQYLINLGNLKSDHFNDSFFRNTIFNRIKNDFLLLKEIELEKNKNFHQDIFNKIPSIILRGDHEQLHEDYLSRWSEYPKLEIKVLKGDHFYFKQNIDSIFLEIKKRGEAFA